MRTFNENNVLTSFKYRYVCTILGTYRMHIFSYRTKVLGDQGMYLTWIHMEGSIIILLHRKIEINVIRANTEKQKNLEAVKELFSNTNTSVCYQHCFHDEFNP